MRNSQQARLYEIVYNKSIWNFWYRQRREGGNRIGSLYAQG
jgi:hypothetical protein